MPNYLDSLIGKVGDSALRSAIDAEVARLRDNKDFGLVFERHLPESVEVPRQPVRVGARVRIREAEDRACWTVRRIGPDDEAELSRNTDGEERTTVLRVDELVVVREFGEPIFPGLRNLGGVHRGGTEKPSHVVLNGENYHALETLLYVYEGAVDCIYIDPPYNTRDKDWKYNNDYVDSDDDYRHSKWLSFMERRLHLAKRLLRDDRSVLIVTIDENEFHRLGSLLDQLFPHATRQMVTSVIKPSGSRRATEFSRVEEYIFFVMIGSAYPRSWTTDMLRDTDVAETESKAVTWHGLRRRGSTDWKRSHRPNGFYPVFVSVADLRIHSVGDPLPAEADRRTVKPPAGTFAAWPLAPDGAEGRWQVAPRRFREQLQDGTLALNSADAETGACSIVYLKSGDLKRIESGEVEVVGRADDGRVIVASESPDARRPKTMWVRESHDASTHGTALLTRFIGDRRFPFPKSLYAVEDCLRFFVEDLKDALILDFFGGSGTTAHAVARLNRQDGGRRRTVLVTNNEVSNDEAKALRADGKRPGDPKWEALGIFEYITRPRLEAAVTGKRPDGKAVTGDYRFVDEFPMAEGLEENIEFFALEYLDRDAVDLGLAFEFIAPLLWMKAGAQGAIPLTPEPDWLIAPNERFGVLFDAQKWTDFVETLRGKNAATHAFVVTDSLAVFQQVLDELPDWIDATMLYADYLTTFTINTALPS